MTLSIYFIFMGGEFMIISTKSSVSFNTLEEAVVVSEIWICVNFEPQLGIYWNTPQAENAWLENKILEMVE